ncbi:MAG: histidine phosphatase family protein [Solirubrobacterales bacterium]
MRRLYLLRHAKASWELAGDLDYGRGLTERGFADCELMRGPIKKLPAAPELVLCSGARRARETLDGVAPALPKDTRIEYDDRIYQASVERLIKVLREVPSETGAVLMVGHNPSMHDVAVELAADGPELDGMAGSFPKAALAVLEFEDPWTELASDSAELTQFIRPKTLRKAAEV